MIGAVLYRLRAMNSCLLPLHSGRLMHGAFFQMLRDFSPEVSAVVHEEMNIKPFTVSELNPQEKLRRKGNFYQVRQGDLFYWRITALNDVVLRVVLEARAGRRIRAGRLDLQLESLVADGSHDTGVVDEEELVSGAFSVEDFREICFDFVSPVSFRVNNKDYPMPRPELVFSSLADKWTQAGMPGAVDRAVIRELAQNIYPQRWEGRTERVFFDANRGMLSFRGHFAYDLSDVPKEEKPIFLMLSQFAAFSGTGRLTGQGMGQTRAAYH